MQAFSRPSTYPHQLVDQRLNAMTSDFSAYGSSLASNLASSSSSSSVDPRPQEMVYLPHGMPAGMMTYPSGTQERALHHQYAVSPDTVWAQSSPSQMMPAIPVSSGQTPMQHLTPTQEPSAMFPALASTSMPQAPLVGTSSTASFGPTYSHSYTSHSSLPVASGDSLQWDVLGNNAVRHASSGYPSQSINQEPSTYGIGQQPGSMVPSQAQVPSMGWIQPGVNRQEASFKAETLPPNSPGCREEDPVNMHRHVSAPSTPVTPVDASRAYSMADFRHLPPAPQDMHSGNILISSPAAGPSHQYQNHPYPQQYQQLPPQHQHQHAHQHQHQQHHLYSQPRGVPTHAAPLAEATSRPSTTGSLALDQSPVPFLDRNFGSDDAKYEAVLSRSHAADRAFVCAATTTRIYCRPSCASKRPDRSRLRFFANPSAAEKAEQAGFRPCKRCKPQTPGTADQCVLAVGDCARHMVMSARNPSGGGGNDDDDDEIRRGTLKEYSARANLSAFHFHRTFKAVTSVTLGELGKALNTLALQDSLGDWTSAPAPHLPSSSSLPMRASPPPAEDIAHLLVGWSARRARRALGGLAPNMYAAGCPDSTIRYVSTNSAFGPVAMAYLIPSGSDSGAERAPPLNRINSSPMPVAAVDEGFHGYFNPLQHQHPHQPHSQQLHQHQQAGPSQGVPTPVDVLPPSPPSNAILLTCVLNQDPAAIITRRFPTAVPHASLAPWLMSIVEELYRTGSREVQLPPEIVGAIRRARVYIEVMHQMTPKRTPSDPGAGHDTFPSSSSLDTL